MALCLHSGKHKVLVRNLVKIAHFKDSGTPDRRLRGGPRYRKDEILSENDEKVKI